jgi:Amt family ammonium transporter
MPWYLGLRVAGAGLGLEVRAPRPGCGVGRVRLARCFTQALCRSLAVVLVSLLPLNPEGYGGALAQPSGGAAAAASAPAASDARPSNDAGLSAPGASPSGLGIQPSEALNDAAAGVKAVEATPPEPVASAPAAHSALVRPTWVPLAQINAGDTAWMITATALVLLMTLPGLALFYAGMVRKKNILATMAQTITVCAVVSVLWCAVGYSWAFMPGGSFLGDLSAWAMESIRYDRGAAMVSVHPLAPTVPEAVFAMFQLTFAIVTPALIAGAFAERMRFSAMLLFMASWSLVVYAPVAHWVWEPGGWLAQRGVLDFAGGTVVHINAGIAGLVAAWMLGPRRGYGKEPLMPSNLAYSMVGASLLWVGWLGFNGGSAAAADGRAGMAILATHMAAAAGVLAWMMAEWLVRGTPTLLGLCSGAVAGLVAITPASGFVGPGAALAIGAVAGLACYWGATGLKRWIGADDSLDVFGVHGIGGIVGALLTGVFASTEIGGASSSVANQAVGVVVTLVYSGAASALLLWLIDRTVGLRVNANQEVQGLDISQHGERVE